jgi:hypothetical protein
MGGKLTAEGVGDSLGGAPVPQGWRGVRGTAAIAQQGRDLPDSFRLEAEYAVIVARKPG